METEADNEYIVLKTYNILVIDDEAAVTSSLKRLFRGSEFQVYTATSGTEGIEIIKNHEIDVVISDLNMPEIDGIKLLTTIATERPTIKRILLTGNADLRTAIKAINAGQICSLQLKPWDNTQLTLAVRKAIEAKHLEDEKNLLLEDMSRDNKKLQARVQELNQKALTLFNELQAKQ